MGVPAQHGVAAERLDRGDFGIQKRYKFIPLYQGDTFQPPAERQAVGPLCDNPLSLSFIAGAYISECLISCLDRTSTFFCCIAY
jgi:hypothetical protein